MLLKKLVIENLRSYDNQIVEFPKGSTLLSGDIGSGKTTILLAVEFALFGLQPSQKANSLLRNGVDNGKVVLEFEIEGKQVVIERTLKRGKKSITQDYVSLVVDSDRFEESVTEIKAKILDLLNYPSEFAKKTNLLYKFTVYTPQEEMKQIIMEPRDIRLNTLRHVFGIDKYKRIQENASLLTARLREKVRINEAMLQDLDAIKEGLVEMELKLVELKESEKVAISNHNKALEYIANAEKSVKEIEDKINEKKKLENDKEKSEMMILEKKRQIDSYVNSIAAIRKEVADIGKLKFSQEEYESLGKRIEFQENKEGEVQKEYMDVIGKLKSFESKKSEVENLVNKISGLDNCPTCMQEVSEDYKSNILESANKQVESVDKLISEMNEKKKELVESLDSAKKVKEEYLNKKSEFDLLKVKFDGIKEKEGRIEDIESQRKELVSEIADLEKEVLRINGLIKEYEIYNKQYDDRMLEFEGAKKEEGSAAIKRAEISKEVGFLELQIKESKIKIDEKEKLNVETDKFREMEDWISSKFLEIVLFTEKQVMITLKQEFSNLFSKWFSILVSESLTARLDDDFSPLIEQQDFELDYSFLSGGERTAIALAYRLSLNQVINSLLSNIKTSNIVILDEPTDGFSAQQLEKMREVLEQLETEQLILVSHEQKMEDFVDNVLRVEKDSGISKVD